MQYDKQNVLPSVVSHFVPPVYFREVPKIKSTVVLTEPLIALA